MASNAPGACCISGVKHEGESVGEIKEIDGSLSQIALQTSAASLIEAV